MQDKLDCQHNFCGWSYLFKGTEEKDLWSLLSSPPRPSQGQPSHSSWVRHTKMDIIRTESTSSLSSCFLPCISVSISCLHFPVPPPPSAMTDPLWSPRLLSPWRPHMVLACMLITGSAELDTHHQHWLLFYAHQTHSAHHLSEKLLDEEQVETGKISTWQSLPALNYISVSTRQCPHIFLPLFHPLQSFSSISYQENGNWLGSWKEQGEGIGGVERGVKMGSGQKQIEVKRIHQIQRFGIKGKAPDALK